MMDRADLNVHRHFDSVDGGASAVQSKIFFKKDKDRFQRHDWRLTLKAYWLDLAQLGRLSGDVP